MNLDIDKVLAGSQLFGLTEIGDPISLNYTVPAQTIPINGQITYTFNIALPTNKVITTSLLNVQDFGISDRWYSLTGPFNTGPSPLRYVVYIWSQRTATDIVVTIQVTNNLAAAPVNITAFIVQTRTAFYTYPWDD